MAGSLTPKVSIIIPLYNGAKYLNEAIDSALNQTYPNIEVIVVNDGSNDQGGTEKIALSYGDKIRYFVKENGGVSSALNLGIKVMEGEYFSWLSHDDLYYPDKIELQIKYLQENPLDQPILYGGYNLIDESSQVVASIKPDSLYPLEKLDIPLFPVLKGLINGCSLLIHKSYFDKVGLFDESLQLAQDYALWFKMFRGAKIKFLPGISIGTRIHTEQQSKNKVQLNLKECNQVWKSFIDDLTVV